MQQAIGPTPRDVIARRLGGFELMPLAKTRPHLPRQGNRWVHAGSGFRLWYNENARVPQ